MYRNILCKIKYKHIFNYDIIPEYKQYNSEIRSITRPYNKKSHHKRVWQILLKTNYTKSKTNYLGAIAISLLLQRVTTYT